MLHCAECGCGDGEVLNHLVHLHWGKGDQEGSLVVPLIDTFLCSLSDLSSVEDDAEEAFAFLWPLPIKSMCLSVTLDLSTFCVL